MALSAAIQKAARAGSPRLHELKKLSDSKDQNFKQSLWFAGLRLSNLCGENWKEAPTLHGAARVA